MVDDFVVRRNDGAPAYNLAVSSTTRGRSIGEVVRGDDLLETTPRQLFLARAARAARAGLRARAARARAPTARGWPSATARSPWTTTTRRGAVRWMAATLGMPGAGTAAEMRAAFDPAALPRTPTRWAGLRTDVR